MVTVFRSRLRAGADHEYHEAAEHILALASAMPGFLDFKTFAADDGERVSVITFDSLEHHRAWRDHPEHQAVQRLGHDRFYASYRIAVCELLHERAFGD